MLNLLMSDLKIAMFEENIQLERCNRCCSNQVEAISVDEVRCQLCGFSESLEVWQIFGWRSIAQYPPTYKGVIFVYGKSIGRTIAHWDSETKTCDNPGATHWLRTPDPRKQINMRDERCKMIESSQIKDLYDPEKSGIVILKNVLSDETLAQIQLFIQEKQSLFEVKREKFIANNQTVFLLYRGGFDFSYFEGTVFEEVMSHYVALRDRVHRESRLPFRRGNSVEIKLIHYPLSELGVGIHKDLSSNINMIVFYNLAGEADVKTYSTKEGKNPLSHPVKAGDASIMRAPRSEEEPDIRPYHAVEKVEVERTVIVIREIDEVLEEITNQDNWRGF